MSVNLSDAYLDPTNPNSPYYVPPPKIVQKEDTIDAPNKALTSPQDTTTNAVTQANNLSSEKSLRRGRRHMIGLTQPQQVIDLPPSPNSKNIVKGRNS